MKTYRKDVSDEEVRLMMAPHIAELMKHVVPPVSKEPEAGPEKQVKDTRKAGVTADVRELLEDVIEKPNLSVTARASRLGLSAYKMNGLKRAAIKQGYVEQFSVNLGKLAGGTITLLGLVEKGYRLLGRKPVERPENVSWEHWWWQVAICDYFNKKRIRAEIEKSRNGKRVDVCLVIDGTERAIEVELSPKNAVPNVAEDLKAGFDRVDCCCKDTAVAKEVRRRLAVYEDYANIKDRVEVRVLTELQLVKELFGK